MCIGFIAVTKKGQDLTRPGEKDDLRQILDKQIEDIRKNREHRQRSGSRAGSRVTKRPTFPSQMDLTSVGGRTVSGRQSPRPPTRLQFHRRHE